MVGFPHAVQETATNKRKNNKMTETKTTKTTYSCKVVIWSAIGHTPLTNRGSCYQDELLRKNIEVVSPGDARNKCVKLINTTTHADYGFWYAPEMPEGPTDGWTHGGRASA